ncbi:L,D-transpeptidase family protein [Sandaracinobacteroides saxicola]|uniref:L,D-TPase catalytic domain-containing protein n=1 Tax=Sandaracinobacteroides saxicola TaxID=2759707 RepID=A0A7G5IE65_9SPHN|nr:L,D-transpeptidase family protein [Sandaracinobacteroides saxicola]QMW21657.1 hypothetical protein H3309_09510 [Sandaracinobacteroides saxicola]
MIVAEGVLRAFGEAVPCVTGRGGVVDAAAKREGDGATPRGTWALRGVLLRPDRVAAMPLVLPWRWLRPADGWSDGVDDPAYNRPVVHPHRFSAERLWRDDAVYDVIVVLGHNDAPVVAGAGSAIFWHLMRDDGAPTEGCLAVRREAMLGLLPRLRAGIAVTVV